MQDQLFALSENDLVHLVRRLKKARSREGGLGPTEAALLSYFEVHLPQKIRPIEPPPTEEIPSSWDV